MRIIENINEDFGDLISFFNEKIRKELELKLKKLTGIKFDLVVNEIDETLISIGDNAEDILPKIGAFKTVLNKIWMEGDAFVKNDTLIGELSFKYESKSGGRNGLTLINFFYKNGKLTFTDGGRKPL